jgi:hypothetical protein
MSCDFYEVILCPFRLYVIHLDSLIIFQTERISQIKRISGDLMKAAVSALFHVRSFMFVNWQAAASMKTNLGASQGKSRKHRLSIKK